MTNNYPVYAKLSQEKSIQLGWDDFDLKDNNFDCGFIPGQGCNMIATEECDFDCPYREELMKHPAYPNCDLLASDYSM